MKITSWSVNSFSVWLPQVLQCLETNPVDVLALQELKLNQDKFPISDLEQVGCHAAWLGQETYNGALLSKGEASDVLRAMSEYEDEKRMIAATINGIGIINVYCEIEKRLIALNSYTNKLGLLPYTNLYPLKCSNMKK